MQRRNNPSLSAASQSQRYLYLEPAAEQAAAPPLPHSFAEAGSVREPPAPVPATPAIAAAGEGESTSAALAAEARLRQAPPDAVDSRIPPPPPPPPVAEPVQGMPAIDQWHKAVADLAAEIKVRHYSPKTLKSYSVWVRKFQFFTRNKEIGSVSSAAVKEYMKFLAARQKVSSFAKSSLQRKSGKRSFNAPMPL